MRYVPVFALMFAVPGSVLAQTGTLDQTSPHVSASFNLDASFLIWQAQIKAGLPGQLEGIRLTFTQGNPGSQINLRIRDGAAPSSNPVLFSTVVTKALTNSEVVFVDMTAANIALSAGQIFVMEAQGTGTGCWLGGSYVAPPGVPLYPEPLFLGTQPQGDGGWRLAFQTFMLGGNPCYPDCNEDNALTVADFGCFQTRFVAGDPYADCNGDLSLTVADFGCFQTKFVGGCP